MSKVDAGVFEIVDKANFSLVRLGQGDGDAKLEPPQAANRRVPLVTNARRRAVALYRARVVQVRVRVIVVAIARDDRLAACELGDVAQSDRLHLLPRVGLVKARETLLVQAASFGVGPALGRLGQQIEVADGRVAVLVELVPGGRDGLANRVDSRQLTSSALLGRRGKVAAQPRARGAARGWPHSHE